MPREVTIPVDEYRRSFNARGAIAHADSMRHCHALFNFTPGDDGRVRVPAPRPVRTASAPAFYLTVVRGLVRDLAALEILNGGG